MRAKDLRAKNPSLWDEVRDGVFEDLRVQKKIHGFEISEKAAEVIAHNAAFMAVSAIEKVRKFPVTVQIVRAKKSHLSKIIREMLVDLGSVQDTTKAIRKFDKLQIDGHPGAYGKCVYKKIKTK